MGPLVNLFALLLVLLLFTGALLALRAPALARALVDLAGLRTFAFHAVTLFAAVNTHRCPTAVFALILFAPVNTHRYTAAVFALILVTAVNAD